MSQPDSTEIRLGILSYINVYTVMLGLSLLSILLAIGLLTIELTRYEWDTEAKTAQRATPAVVQSTVVQSTA